jgi:hypothetical protein
MAKKKLEIKTPAHWDIEESIQINGRNVEAGTEISVKGERGRFRFLRKVTTPTASWIDCIGGRKGYETYRSFETSKIKTIHRKNTLRTQKAKSKTTPKNKNSI